VIKIKTNEKEVLNKEDITFLLTLLKDLKYNASEEINKHYLSDDFKTFNKYIKHIDSMIKKLKLMKN